MGLTDREPRAAEGQDGPADVYRYQLAPRGVPRGGQGASRGGGKPRRRGHGEEWGVGVLAVPVWRWRVGVFGCLVMDWIGLDWREGHPPTILQISLPPASLPTKQGGGGAGLG